MMQRNLSVGDSAERQAQLSAKLAEIYGRLGRDEEARGLLESTLDGLTGDLGPAELPLLCRLADLQVSAVSERQ